MTTNSPLHGDAAFFALIRSIYDSALDARKWTEFLALLNVEFRSEIGLIWAHDFEDRSIELSNGPSTITCVYGADPHYLASFEQHFHQCNVWTQDETLHREGGIVNSSEIYPEHKLQYTEWYGDWLRHQNLFYSFAVVVEKRQHRSFNVTTVRTRPRGPYTPYEIGRLQLLIPHLQTAFALHRRLHRANALAHASLAVVEGLPIAVVLLDEQANVLHANSRSRVLMESTQLLYLDVKDSLRAARTSDDVRLQQAMRLSVSTGLGLPISAGAALRLHGMDGKTLHAMVAPLPRWSEPFGERAAGAVFLSNPDSTISGIEQLLKEIYRLTPAESRLVEALLNGLTLAEYAQRCGLSIHTVRSQMKSTTTKVGTSRQADLVRAVLTGPLMARWASG